MSMSTLPYSESKQVIRVKNPWGCRPLSQITCEYNGLSLQQWYQVYKGDWSFSFVFFAFIAIFKKIHCILAVSATETLPNAYVSATCKAYV